ncbi:MAG: GYD domain-containing protein [Chloroflexi bacterium]|nr:GYD domain-containing protein [Chloroflexota bacterium]
MAQYLWQSSLTSSAWKNQVAGDITALFDAGDDDAKHFGGKVLHSWVAFGEYDFIAVVEMPDNESMAAFVLAMTAKGHYSAGKTTILLSSDETKAATQRAASLG